MLSWLIGLPLAVLVVVFALSNRQEVTLGLWPFTDGLAVPAYLAVLLPLLAGLVLGLTTGSVRAFRHRRHARAQEKKAKALERQLNDRDSAPPPPAGDLSVPP